MTHDTNSPKKPSTDILHRRAEKGWMFRESERSWTQFVWMLLVTSQTMLLGIAAVALSINSKSIPMERFRIVCGVTAVELILFVWLSAWRRHIDADRAVHFEKSVIAGELGTNYDHNSADRRYDVSNARWHSFSFWCEVLSLTASFGTAMVLLASIGTLEPK